jgi:2-polyprenyl-3-methyl-5-hydroxy-6-metoxy-1,4-benzoquinol methylase
MRRTVRRSFLVLLLGVSVLRVVGAQTEGRVALEAFVQWRNAQGIADLSYSGAIAKYREKLLSDGLSAEAAERTLRLIEAYEESEPYNRIYSQPPTFNTRPNQLLVDAIDGFEPGKALDVGMGQGRNTIFLASKGFAVTGFDVAEVGLQKAEEQAAALGLKVRCILASDEEFDFGREQWDVIAIIYAIEKRSVHRVAQALAPGGIVVIEAGHKEASGAPFEYETNELLRIFDGFRILRYEDTVGSPDWGTEKVRLVRLVAQKPPGP